jgi:hypothetical protein
MKRVAILMAVLALAAGCDDNETPTQPSNTGPIVFTAQLTAANEVPPITGAEANARGTVTITFNVPRDSSGNITGGGSATFGIQLNSFPAGTPAILAHIHTGAQGVAGGVFVNTGLSAAAPIVMGDGTANQSITINHLTQEQATQVVSNPAGHYFNVHTQLNPGGAVRGQLTRTQ